MIYWEQGIVRAVSKVRLFEDDREILGNSCELLGRKVVGEGEKVVGEEGEKGCAFPSGSSFLSVGEVAPLVSVTPSRTLMSGLVLVVVFCFITFVGLIVFLVLKKKKMMSLINSSARRESNY